MGRWIVIGEAVWMIALIVTPLIQKKIVSNKWRYLYVVPAIVTCGLAFLVGFNPYLVGMCVASILTLSQMDLKITKAKMILSGMSVLVLFVSLGLGDRVSKRIDFKGDFELAFSNMKAHYVLDVEKGIDWEALYIEYAPQFAEVTKAQDQTEGYCLWQEYLRNFYDGHVSFVPGDVFKDEEIYKAYGNDYGLSLLRLADGRFVAVNVEGAQETLNGMADVQKFNAYSIMNPDRTFPKIQNLCVENVFEKRLTLKKAGIHNGTVITKWNGKPVEDWFENVRCYLFQCPDRENELFYLPLYVAGIGGESVSIEFLDDAGEHKSVEAPKLGAYLGRVYSTLDLLDNGVNISNLDWQEINEDTVLLRIYSMSYDIKSYSGSDYSQMMDELRPKILEYRERGMKNLIIDLRKNTGGSPYMVAGVATLFAPAEEFPYYYSAVLNEKTGIFERGEDGKYQKGKAVTYSGEDLWKDGKIILLVNGETVSAGDDMTNLMAKFPNVWIMGFTKSNSSCQAVKEMRLSSGKITFSAVPNLDENGDVIIDTGVDHVGRVPCDEIVPITEEVIKKMFDKGEDFLLEYAISQFETNHPEG